MNTSDTARSSFWKINWRIFIYALSAGIIGITTIDIAPNLIDAYTDTVLSGGLGLNEMEAGQLLTLELLTTAVATMCIGLLIKYVRLVTLGAISLIIFMFANLISLFVALPELSGIRLIVGATAGIMLGIGNAVVARSTDPDRLYGIILAVQRLTSAVVVFVVPFIMSSEGYRGGYILLLASSVVLTPMLLLLSKSMPRSHITQQTHHSDISLFVVTSLLTGTVLISMGSSAIYAFSVIIGKFANLSDTQIGFILALTGLLGGLGPVGVAVLGKRFGRILPLTVAIMLMAVSSIGIVLIMHPAIFFVLQLCLAVTFMFSLTYILGLGASIDSSGGLSAMVSGFSMIGAAAGPIVAGSITVSYSYISFGVIMAIILMVALIALIFTEKLSNSYK